MSLPLGKASENIKVGRARARVLFVLFGLVLAAGVFVPSHGARAAVAFVDSATAAPGSVSTFNITHTLTNGTFDVVIVSIKDTTKTVSSITDNGSSGGSTYYFRNATNNGSNVRIEVWSTTHAGVTGSPTQITVNLSGASQVVAISAQYSGVAGLGAGKAVAVVCSTVIPDATATANGFILEMIASNSTGTYTPSGSGNLRTSVVGTANGAALHDDTNATPGGTTNQVVSNPDSLCVLATLDLQAAATGTAGGRLVQGVAGVHPTDGAVTISVPFETPNTAGNLIVVGVSVADTTNSVTVSDLKGNSYSTAVGPINDTGSAYQSSVFYAANIAGGTNLVRITTTKTGRIRVLIHEFSGADTSSPLDQTSSNTGSGTALDSGSKTTLQNNELIFGFGAVSIASVFSAGTNFTTRVNVNSGSSASVGSEDRVVTNTASYSAPMTINPTGNWVMLMATFKDAGQGGDARLTQRAFILENDTGNTVDTNTQRGTGIAYPVEQGERFIVRFQVDNTGAGATTAQFTVQYDHNDGVWKSVTSGEISTQLGISGSNGDALTTNKAGSCQGGTSFVNGVWQEGTATTGSFTLTNGNCTEFGFIFSTATAVPRTTYNFRLVNGTNGNQVFQNSVATPSIVLITMREKTYSKTGLGAELAAAPTNANNLPYYLDSTGYAAIIKKDGVYDTANSSGAGNVPISLFKIRNYNENTTDPFTITWIGHSNVAPSSNNVFLDLWDNTHSTWITASTNNFTAAGTDFTFSSATSGSLFYDANYFVYVRVRQTAGVEALSTDQVSLGFGNTSPGFQVDRDDTLSDSRPGVSANQTISFTITMSIDASERVELTWPLAFAFPPDLDCGDADVATGTQFMLSTTSTACAATATTWGVEFMSDTRVFRLTAPSTAGTYVATGTKITITIGTNASAQQTGTTQIVNPASTGVYTVSVGGNFAGIGNILVSINAGVDVQATVAESLAFTVSSVAAVNCTADDGATVTAIGTSPTSVPFGIVSLNTFYIGCQDLVVSTNASNGYSLTTQESSAMKTANGSSIIPDTTCDGGTCSESVAGAWINAAKNGLGHTCANQVNHDCSSAYSSGTNFLQFANMAGGETAQAVMSSSTNATATGRIKLRLSAGLAQPAGDYTTLITYTIYATY
jgi:hypothetical protein